MFVIFGYQFNSVSQLCLTLCDPTDCSTSGFPVHHQLPKVDQTHVHQVGDAVQPSHPSSVIPFSSCLQSFPALGYFPMSQFFTSGGQSFSFIISLSNEYSGLVSFRMDWLDLLAAQETQESSPTPQFKSISSLALSFLYGLNLTSIHGLLDKP